MKNQGKTNIILISVCFSILFSQVPLGNVGKWYTIGAGIGESLQNRAGNSSLLSGKISYGREIKKLPVQFIIERSSGVLTGPEICSFNILSGRRQFGDNYFFSQAIGPSFLTYRYRQNDEAKTKNNGNSMGLAISCQFHYKVFSEFGIGLDLYGNLNGQVNVAGIRLELMIHNTL